MFPMHLTNYVPGMTVAPAPHKQQFWELRLRKAVLRPSRLGHTEPRGQLPAQALTVRATCRADAALPPDGRMKLLRGGRTLSNSSMLTCGLSCPWVIVGKHLLTETWCAVMTCRLLLKQVVNDSGDSASRDFISRLTQFSHGSTFLHSCWMPINK
jgi:hypothetical protein